MLHQGTCGAGVLPRRHARGGGGCDRALELGLGRNLDARFLRCGRQNHPAVIAQQRSRHRRRICLGNGRQQLLDQLIFVGDPGAGLVVEEVADVLLREGAALGLVAIGVGVLVERSHPLLGAIQLGTAEAELADPQRLDRQHAEPVFQLAVLDLRGHGERRHVLAEPAVADTGAEKFRVGAALELAEALVHHVVDRPRDQVAAVIGDLGLTLARPLPDDLHVRLRDLGVGHHAHQRLLMERHLAIGDRRRGSAILQRGEQFLDRLLDLLLVNVADDDDRLPFRPVPGVVERAQPRHRGVADDLRFADRQPLGVARVVEEHRELLVADARSGAQPAAPLLDDDAAFLVHFLLRERQSAGKVGERGQAFRHDVRLVARQVEHVDGFVEAGVRVHVRAEPRADRFEVRHQLARLEVRAAVERHVLDQVREPKLIVGLEQRSRLHREPHRHALRGPRIRPDEVGEAVGQLRGAHGGVERNRVRRVERLRDEHGRRRHEREQRGDYGTGKSGLHTEQDRSTIISGWIRSSRLSFSARAEHRSARSAALLKTSAR